MRETRALHTKVTFNYLCTSPSPILLATSARAKKSTVAPFHTNIRDQASNDGIVEISDAAIDALAAEVAKMEQENSVQDDKKVRGIEDRVQAHDRSPSSLRGQDSGTSNKAWRSPPRNEAWEYRLGQSIPQSRRGPTADTSTHFTRISPQTQAFSSKDKLSSYRALDINREQDNYDLSTRDANDTWSTQNARVQEGSKGQISASIIKRHWSMPRLSNDSDDNTYPGRAVENTNRNDDPRNRDGSERVVPLQKDREYWQIQKAALKAKFGDEPWNPRKRLSPDALAGIRAIHAQFPNEYTTPVLAAQFEVSPEVIRRILKSKWRPDTEEEIDRQNRWFKRGEKIWTSLAEKGYKAPAKWRAVGIKSPRPEYMKKKRIAHKVSEDGIVEEQQDESRAPQSKNSKRRSVPKVFTTTKIQRG